MSAYPKSDVREIAEHVCVPATWWHSGEYRLVECRQCGLIWLDSAPARDASLYDREYYRRFYWEQRERRRGFFERWLTDSEMRPCRVLDVGCGIGLFLDVAAPRGFMCSGVEPNMAAVEFQNPAHDIRPTTLEQAGFAPGAFQLITFWDVLAHLEDPAAALRSAGELLDSGGKVLVKTPNRAGPTMRVARALSSVGGTRGWLHLPAQVFQFSEASLKVLLERCGFEVKSVERLREPVRPSLMSLVGNPKQLCAVMLRGALDLFGDPESMIVTAQKRGPR